MRYILATNNDNKVKEIKDIIDIDVVTLKDLGIEDDIEEYGKTFEINALIKAQAIGKLFKDDIIIADDSGLEVDYLDGAPGIYSKRYAHNEPGYEEDVFDVNRKKLLKELDGVKNRKANFRCSICVYSFNLDICQIFNGYLHGTIGDKVVIKNGFAYDALFITNDNKYLSEYEDYEKNKISHRYDALKKLKESGILNV